MAGSIINLLYEEAQRIWRYRWLVVAVALALFTTAAAYIMRLPDIYEVSAQILVNKQTTLTAAAGDASLVGGEFGSPYVVQQHAAERPAICATSSLRLIPRPPAEFGFVRRNGVHPQPHPDRERWR